MKLTYLTIAAAAVLLVAQDADGERPPVAEIGKPAPVFRLNDHEGRVATVGGESDMWTAVAFYPKAMTGG
jgi:hypothetical protein